LRSEGQSLWQISNTLGLAKSTIQKINDKYNETGSVQNKLRSGRPRKTSASADRLIVKQFKANRRKPAAEVANEMLHSMEIKISPQTVRNRLYAQGFHERIARR